MADLTAFMDDHAELSWAWGYVDCSIVLADWAVANGHADPAVTWRGAYSTMQQWRNIVIARGGLLPLVSDVCDRAGLAPATTLVAGVIGVIGAKHNVERQWGAIYDGSAWRIRGESGFSTLTARVLGKWMV